jgi:hypothetical protein
LDIHRNVFFDAALLLNSGIIHLTIKHNKMKGLIILYIQAVIFGIVSGLSIVALLDQKQHTLVKVTTIDNVVDWNFRVKNTKDGDAFVITIASDTVFCGVVVDGVLK